MKNIIRNIIREQIPNSASGYGYERKKTETVAPARTNPQKCMHQYSLTVLGGDQDGEWVSSGIADYGYYKGTGEQHSVYYEGEHEWFKRVGSTKESSGKRASMIYQFSSIELGHDEHKMAIGLRWAITEGSSNEYFSDIQFIWQGSYTCEGDGSNEDQGGDHGWINSLAYDRSLVSWWKNDELSTEPEITKDQLKLLLVTPEFKQIYTQCINSFNITSKITLGNFKTKVAAIIP